MKTTKTLIAFAWTSTLLVDPLAAPALSSGGSGEINILLHRTKVKSDLSWRHILIR